MCCSEVNYNIESGSSQTYTDIVNGAPVCVIKSSGWQQKHQLEGTELRPYKPAP